MKPVHIDALRQAASGAVSGTLLEWPVLAAAFAALGWYPPLSIRKDAMVGLAKAALAQEKRG